MNKFIDWLMGLEPQILTDQLKLDIIQYVEDEYSIQPQNVYVRIPWPDVQVYMDSDWFSDEAILDTTTSADYLIPIERMDEL
jgi:hypothetical protein